MSDPPPNPPYVADQLGQVHAYVVSKTGLKHPTIALYSTSTTGGTASLKAGIAQAKGAGFKVVYAKANLPATVTDYTPYVQQWMTANSGNSPQ